MTHPTASPSTQRTPNRPSSSPKPPSQLVASPSADSHVGPRRSGGGATAGETGRTTEGGRVKEAFGATPIHHLPTEVLSHVFAHLPPTSLADAQLVCREWRDVIADEASWRARPFFPAPPLSLTFLTQNAFETYYGILSSGLSLGRRLAPTAWRSEYISRVHLLTRWSKSRTPSLTHSPHIGPLTALQLSLPLPSTNSPASLISLSLPSSRASKSDPFTGKVAKLSLGATPLDNLLQPIGLPLLNATAVGVAPDGGRIVWGTQDGSFRVVNSANPVSAAARAWAGIEDGTRVMRGHAARVGAVEFADTRGEWFASVGDEGGVGIWKLEGVSLRRNAPVGTRAWERSVPSGLEARGVIGPKGCTIAFDAGVGGKGGRRAAIAVGMSNGEVHVWRGIGIDGEEGEEAHWKLEGPGTEAVDKLVWDSTADGGASLLVHQVKSPSFLRYSFAPSPSTSPPSSTLFGHKPDHSGALTAFAVDFDEPPPSPLVPTKSDAKISSFTAHSLPPSSTSTSTSSTLSTSPSSASLTSALSEDTSSPSSSDPREALHGVNAFGRRKYVVAGDAQGRVFVWDWEAEATAGVVEPRRMIQGFGSQVTALEISEVAVFVGGLDGALRCYDTITSTLLRTFKDRLASRLPARMLAAGLLDASDEDRWKVSVIKANRESVVAAIGGSVLAWRIAAPEVRKRKTKGNGKMSARAERFRSECALREEVRESMSSLSTESTDRLAQFAQERRLAYEYGLPSSLNNMTEGEAVALAMMLSADEEEARWFSGSGQTSTNTSPAFRPVHDELADMEGLSLDDDAVPTTSGRAFGNRRGADDDGDAADDDHARSPTHGSYSRSLSIPSSPFLRGSSLSGSTPSPSSRSTSHTWRPASQQSSPSFAPYEPHSYSSTHSHTKIQLSPRLGPTYGSLAVPSGPVPDMSEELWPLAQPSSTSPPPLARTASLSVPSPAPATRVRRGWNDIARSASASPSGTNSPGVASPASLLTSRLRATDEPVVDRRNLLSREEEELRFAIELSLAEEASRLER